MLSIDPTFKSSLFPSKTLLEGMTILVASGYPLKIISGLGIEHVSPSPFHSRKPTAADLGTWAWLSLWVHVSLGPTVFRGPYFFGITSAINGRLPDSWQKHCHLGLNDSKSLTLYKMSSWGSLNLLSSYTGESFSHVGWECHWSMNMVKYHQESFFFVMTFL